MTDYEFFSLMTSIWTVGWFCGRTDFQRRWCAAVVFWFCFMTAWSMFTAPATKEPPIACEVRHDV